MSTEQTYVSIADTGTQVVVTEVIAPLWLDGRYVPIGERYTATFVAELIDVTDTVPQPEVGWIYAGGEFSPPAA